MCDQIFCLNSGALPMIRRLCSLIMGKIQDLGLETQHSFFEFYDSTYDSCVVPSNHAYEFWFEA